MAERVVLTAGETMLRLLGPAHTRLRHADQMQLGMAGAETNFATALSRLGHHVRWMSRLGADEAGALIRGRLAAEGIDLSAVKEMSTAPTGLMLREQAPGMQNVYYYRDRSAASHLCADDARQSLLEGVGWVHLTGITPALSDSAAEFCAALIQLAGEKQVPVSLDVNYRARLWSPHSARDWVEQQLPRIDVLMFSKEEGESLWGKVDEPLMRSLAEAGPRHVVRKGDGDYSVALVQGGFHEVGLYSVDAIDTIGAGDAFAAGYLDAVLAGRKPDEALNAGNAMGALCVMGLGDYESLPISRSALEQFMAGVQTLGR